VCIVFVACVCELCTCGSEMEGVLRKAALRKLQCVTTQPLAGRRGKGKGEREPHIPDLLLGGV
jgi:hypothetical protein